jgi:hypothetical protein
MVNGKREVTDVLVVQNRGGGSVVDTLRMRMW